MEGFAVEIGKMMGLALKTKRKRVGVQQLMTISGGAVDLAVPVFAVTQDGMAEIGQVRTDLMGPPRQEIDLQ